MENNNTNSKNWYESDGLSPVRQEKRINELEQAAKDAAGDVFELKSVLAEAEAFYASVTGSDRKSRLKKLGRMLVYSIKKIEHDLR